MSVKIERVERKSIAEKAKIKPNETILAINGNAINDVLDYRFYMIEPRLDIQIQDEHGKVRNVHIKKAEYDDLGLEFHTYLMDEQHSCRNACIFCFIDQLPKGMRESLYFKDDDSRLSFFFGNYITLTNLKEEDIRRIIKMRISPINISIHTMNPELRVKMMKNRFAGESLRYLDMLKDTGIVVNTQLVLCPGINDGEELLYSLEQLEKYYPTVQSVALVPVGLTCHRQGLYPLQGYTQESAKEVIALANRFNEGFLSRHNQETRFAFVADEFFLKAGLPLPPESYYEEYNQLENGVGLLSMLLSEAGHAIDDLEETIARPKREISLATGEAAYEFLVKIVDKLQKKVNNIKCHVYKIQNDTFGHSITVAGLVCGKDIIRQLKGKPLGKELLIPHVMLKTGEDIFLDDCPVQEVERALGVRVTTVNAIDGYDLIEKILGEGI